MKIAALDIGSNAIRLVISENERTVKKIRIPLRLGADAFGPENSFSKSTLEQAKLVFKSMSDLIKKEGVTEYRAYATSAFRDAKNSQVMADLIKKESGLVIEKISGDVEAKLILESVLDTMTLDKKRDYLLFDLGGGSMELSKIEEGEIVGSKSFDLGTVRLMHLKDTKEKFKSVKKEIKAFSGEHLIHSDKLNIIGTGGNFRRILKLRNERYEKEKDYFNEEEFLYLKSELSELSFLQRVKQYEMRPDRADVIITAMEIIGLVLDILPVRRIYAPKAGLINGILNQIRDK